MLPRFTSDLSVDAVSFPSDSIPKDHTLDIVTWNVEWFGDPSNGPDDDNLQMQNAKTLIETMGADLYALQEISNANLSRAIANLDGTAGYWLHLINLSVLLSYIRMKLSRYIRVN